MKSLEGSSAGFTSNLVVSGLRTKEGRTLWLVLRAGGSGDCFDNLKVATPQISLLGEILLEEFSVPF